MTNPMVYFSLFISLVSQGAVVKKAALPSAKQMVLTADDYRSPGGTLSFDVNVKDYRGTELQNDTRYHVFSKNGKLVLVDTVAPERLSGRKLLMANVLWLYLPTVKRPTQVGLQQKLTGEVSNGDIARLQFAKDYSPILLGKEKLGSEECYKLKLTAKSKTATYRYLLLWVTVDTGEPRKADFFALSGKLMKTGEFSGPEKIMGKTRLTKLVIRDALDRSRQSQLKYSNFRPETLDDSFFNKENLAP